jgi:hypothetical protein
MFADLIAWMFVTPSYSFVYYFYTALAFAAVVTPHSFSLFCFLVLLLPQELPLQASQIEKIWEGLVSLTLVSLTPSPSFRFRATQLVLTPSPSFRSRLPHSRLPHSVAFPFLLIAL